MKLFYNLLFLSVGTAITATSCSRPEACIEAQENYFQNLEVEMRSCGDAANFFWDFGDGNGAEGTRVKHNFDTSGHKTITQFAVQSNGRREDETTESIFVGYKKIDSIAVYRLSRSAWNLDRNPNLYITYGNWRSDQTYEDYEGSPSHDNPLIFTFNNIDSRIQNTQLSWRFRIQDDNFNEFQENFAFDSTTSTNPLNDVNDNPQDLEGERSRVSYLIYWQLVE